MPLFKPHNLLIAATSLLLIIYAYLFFNISKSLQAETMADFESEAAATSTEITDVLDNASNSLINVVALFESSTQVNEKEFQEFVEKSQFFETNPYVRAVAVGPILNPDQIKAYESALQSNMAERLALGYPAFKPVQLEGRDLSIPMTLVESPGGRENIVGFDVATSAARLTTTQKSIDTGGIVMTPPVTLSQDAPDAYSSVLLIATSQAAQIEYKEQTTGAAGSTMLFAASFTPGAAINKIVSEKGNRLFELNIIDSSGEDVVIFQGHPDDGKAPTRTDSIEFAGRKWTLLYYPTSAVIASATPAWLIALFLAGLLLLLGLAWSVNALIRIRGSLEEQVALQTQDLREAKQLAENASNAKSKFLSTMSHEIRTPMNGVIGVTQLLRNSQLHEEQRDLLKILEDSADSLMHIINDILDLSKLESNKMTFEMGEFNLKNLLDSTVKIFEQNAKAKGVDVLVKEDADLDHVYRSDSGRIRQILMNLLNNAIKFTEQGHISISAKRKPEQRGLVRFEVEDTGIGIPEDKTEDLFDEFVQADSSISRRYGGTGLGLAIAKRIVNQMGGEIGVISKEKEGSTFWFEIPIEYLGEASQQPAVAGETTLVIKPLKILLVEDIVPNQIIARKFLERMGHSVEIATNGLEAINAVKDQKFDLIYMDIQMPGMDGIDATRKIREMTFITRDLPILAMTANASAEDRDKCIDAGMNDFISKPLDFEKLLHMTSTWTTEH